MTKGQQQVKEFMEFFGQHCPELPTELGEQDSKLRAKLILEEAFETITKGLGLTIFLGQPGGTERVNVSELNLSEWTDDESAITFQKEKETDMEELLDGLADLAYVGEFGTAVAAGVDLEPIQDHIHESNMSKAWKLEDLEKVPYGYTIEPFKDTGVYRVKRPDGKVAKSPSYSEANILPLIQAQIKSAQN